jgi:hypothetical protein
MPARVYTVFVGRWQADIVKGANMRAAKTMALLSLLAASNSLGTAAADGPRWFGTHIEGGAQLIYGTPNSGHIVLSFACRGKAEPLEFTFAHEPIDARPGVRMTVFLAAGDLEISIPTRGERLEMDDQFILSGSVPLDNRLRRLLSTGSNLEVRVDDGVEDYPLDGAAEAAAELFARCG